MSHTFEMLKLRLRKRVNRYVLKRYMLCIPRIFLGRLHRCMPRLKKLKRRQLEFLTTQNISLTVHPISTEILVSSKIEQLKRT